MGFRIKKGGGSPQNGAISTIINDDLAPQRVLISDVNGKVWPSNVTSTEISEISGSVTNSGATIADADRFVHNDDGVMKQTAFSNLWSWITGKVTGAASSILTSNLSTNRALVSDNDGKVVVGSSVAKAHRLYKSVVFLITHSGTTSDPTVTYLENTTGLTFTFKRVGVGQYNITASSSMTRNKTAILTTSYHPNIRIGIDHHSHGVMKMNVYLGDSFSDNRLDLNTVEFRVYD